MSDYKITSKSLLSLFKESVLAETHNSTIYFYGAYILKENIIGKRIIIDVLFVYLKKYDTMDFMMETCFDIFKYIEERKRELLIPLYRDGLDFSIKIKPRFLTLTEFNKLPKENKKMIEEKKISHYARARNKGGSTMSSEMEIDTISWILPAIGRLFQQYLDSKPGYIAGDSIHKWMAEREQAYISFSLHFREDNLKNVEAVSHAYGRWLLYSNNKSWTNMQRVGVRALDQPRKLCKLLSFIQQETVPIEERIQKGLAGEYKVDGIGKGILTALLHTMYPEKYCVWNGSTIDAFKKLDIKIPLMYSKKQGRTYVRINAVLNNMASVLDTTLTLVDGFMWYIATPLLGIIIKRSIARTLKS